ncbi:MAG: L-fucose/L-arabinose isomerase family protein [Candidatus Bathyarchaeia archaeon]
MRVGVFSPNDPRPWVRNENIGHMLKQEKILIEALRRVGVEVIRGGEGLDEMDQIAWNTKLVNIHIKKIVSNSPQALIINQGSWTFPYDSVDAVKRFMAETDDIARVLIFSHKDPKVPGLVAGMAVGGGLNRIGIPFYHVFGDIEHDPKVIDELLSVLTFYEERARSEEAVRRVIKSLKEQKYLALGGMSLKMPTTTADVDQWQKLFGVSYESLDQSELLRRAWRMVEWYGKPGDGEYLIKDERLRKASRYLSKHGLYDYAREKLRSFSKIVYQLSLYYAGLDLVEEYNATFAGVKCQDELSSLQCTACLMAAFLNNDVGPEGEDKPIIPVACENDMDSALTQLILHLLTGKPAGFGDFRDVEDNVLYIINCGQHPPYFFGGPDMDSKAKLDKVEYMGQEIFYDAGGSSVRGRTPGDYPMTVARLGRENLRYRMVATVIETLNVNPSEHERFNSSWPIIKGKIPIRGEELIDVWPCNHLGFTYGDLTPHLAELAHRLDIGYTIYDINGRKHEKPS